MTRLDATGERLNGAELGTCADGIGSVAEGLTRSFEMIRDEYRYAVSAGMVPSLPDHGVPENNVFLGWTLKELKTGFEVLREVMVAGYKPSVARLYDQEDGALHFSHFLGS